MEILAVIIGLLVLLLISVGGAWITYRLLRRTWQRRAVTSLAERVVAFAIAASVVIGASAVLAGGLMIFGALGGKSVDPSQKARVVAEGIATAMNWVALGWVLWMPSTLVALWIGRARKT